MGLPRRLETCGFLGVPGEWSRCYASWGWVSVAHWLAYSVGASSPTALCGLLVL